MGSMFETMALRELNGMLLRYLEKLPASVNENAAERERIHRWLQSIAEHTTPQFWLQSINQQANQQLPNNWYPTR